MFRVYYAPVLMLTFHETATVDLEIFVVKYFCGLRKPRKKKTRNIFYNGYTIAMQNIFVRTISQHS